MTTDHRSFVRWFRDSSPYIHAHRGRTFVLSFGGEAVADPDFSNHVHDFALLNSLGIRLVLVHGIRPQIDQRLARRQVESTFVSGMRVTDPVALECVKEAAGLVRVELEALLSMGLPNSPMAGARVRASSGNLVIAKPYGVRDGIDFGHTGEVRRVDTEAIRQKLDQGHVVLLSPIGYSPTGEVFNLRAEDVATKTAVALRADKLLLMMEEDLAPAENGALIRQMTTNETESWLAAHGETLSPGAVRHLQAAVEACRAGVQRAHLVNRHLDGAILQELFTRDGAGTLVSVSPFEDLRTASIDDVGGILELIGPLEQNGTLVPRSREALEMEIGRTVILERDGLVVGCAALHPFPEEEAAELACLAVHPGYRGHNRGQRLLDQIICDARGMGLKRLFVLTTQTTHWFREHGFEPARVSDLPMERRSLYNFKRNSKVLVKPL